MLEKEEVVSAVGGEGAECRTRDREGLEQRKARRFRKDLINITEVCMLVCGVCGWW